MEFYIDEALAEDIVIPGSVINISDFAFFGCNSLESITIEEGVQSIGKCVFMSCSNLTDVTIPDSVTKIGMWSDYGAPSSLTIYAHSGSYAEEYAIENKIQFEAID